MRHTIFSTSSTTNPLASLERDLRVLLLQRLGVDLDAGRKAEELDAVRAKARAKHARRKANRRLARAKRLYFLDITSWETWRIKRGRKALRKAFGPDRK